MLGKVGCELLAARGTSLVWVSVGAIGFGILTLIFLIEAFVTGRTKAFIRMICSFLLMGVLVVGYAVLSGFGIFADRGWDGAGGAASRPTITWGESYRGQELLVSVAEARVQLTRGKEWGTEGVSDEPHLHIVLSVQNTTRRRILHYAEEGLFDLPNFRVTDDAGNAIRRIGFGFGSSVSGQLESGTDIDPGDAVSHLLVFRVPPRATKYLVLTVDLEAFGSGGEPRFRIPADRIVGFEPRQAPARPDQGR